MVMVREHSGLEEINAGVASIVKALATELADTDRNAATNGESTTMGGFQTPADMAFLNRDEEPVKALRNQVILPAVEHYLGEVLGADPLFTPFVLKSWANILTRGHWQGPHMHPKEYTVISGVYYVAVPEAPAPSGRLEFINPNLSSVSLGAQSATRRHESKTGQILLFPPYYMHFVHPVQEDQQRIVVAFDVRLDR